MIPSLIAVGLLLGRWWRTALAAGVVVWVVGLTATEVLRIRDIPVAAGLALLNTGVGVLLHQAVLHAVRRVRGGTRAA